MRQDLVQIRWYEGVFARNSRRAFYDKPIDPVKAGKLAETARILSEDSVRIELVLSGTSTIFKGIVGGYGKIEYAPAYVAFIGDTTDPHVQQKIGYYGECFILEATMLGLGTCWVSAMFNPAQVCEQFQLRPTEEVFAVSPIGLPPPGYRRTDRLLRALSGSKRRRGLDSLVQGVKVYELPDWIVGGLTAVQVAPSAVNSQPWVFEVLPGCVKLKNRPKLIHKFVNPGIDWGIAMLHFELGALERRKPGTWKLLSDPYVASYHT